MLDHSRKAPPGVETTGLIELLIRELDDGALPKLRLLLLDWAKPVQTVPLEEELRLFQKRDIRKGLETIAQEGGHQVSAAKLDDETDALTEGLGERFLPEPLETCLLPACERIFGPADAD